VPSQAVNSARVRDTHDTTSADIMQSSILGIHFAPTDALPSNEYEAA